MRNRDPKWYIGFLASLALAATYADAYFSQISEMQAAKKVDVEDYSTAPLEMNSSREVAQ